MSLGSDSISQDAHELFHVLTSSLEDERDRQPRVTHLFDVHSLEVIPFLPLAETPGICPHSPVESVWLGSFYSAPKAVL